MDYRKVITTNIDDQIVLSWHLIFVLNVSFSNLLGFDQFVHVLGLKYDAA